MSIKWFLGDYITKDNLRNAKAEISKLVSKANKRLQRLEKADLTSSPAYKKWVNDGKGKFSVKGKSHNDLQKELSRLNNFLDSETSTIRGTNNVLKEMAKNTAIDYKDLNDLRNKAAKFFELSSKVEQYLRSVDDIASAIGYQKIWSAINQYVKESETDLDGANQDIDDLVEKISDLINSSYEIEVYSNNHSEWWYV